MPTIFQISGWTDGVATDVGFSEDFGDRFRGVHSCGHKSYSFWFSLRLTGKLQSGRRHYSTLGEGGVGVLHGGKRADYTGG